MPRQRSLHSRNSRASPRRTACRRAMSASAAPLAVARVRSSVAPRVCRCRSSRARPRSHAASMPRQRSSASHQVAWASQPTLRVRSWPRCRAFAAVRRWRAASSRRPAARAIRPVSRWASTARAGSSSSSRAVTRRAAGSSAAARSLSSANRHRSRTSSARAAHHGRCWRRNSRRASALRSCARPKSPVAAAARAEEYSSSARLVAEPWSCSILATAALTSRRASRARPAASSTVHLLTNRSASKMPSWSNRAWAWSRWASAVGRSPRACAASPRSWRADAYSSCWPHSAYSVSTRA